MSSGVYAGRAGHGQLDAGCNLAAHFNGDVYGNNYNQHLDGPRNACGKPDERVEFARPLLFVPIVRHYSIRLEAAFKRNLSSACSRKEPGLARFGVGLVHVLHFIHRLFLLFVHLVVLLFGSLPGLFLPTVFIGVFVFLVSQIERAEFNANHEIAQRRKIEHQMRERRLPNGKGAARNWLGQTGIGKPDHIKALVGNQVLRCGGIRRLNGKRIGIDVNRALGLDFAAIGAHKGGSGNLETGCDGGFNAIIFQRGIHPAPIRKFFGMTRTKVLALEANRHKVAKTGKGILIVESPGGDFFRRNVTVLVCHLAMQAQGDEFSDRQPQLSLKYMIFSIERRRNESRLGVLNIPTVE